MYGAEWEVLGEKVQYRGLTVARLATARRFEVGFYKWLSVALGSGVKLVPIGLGKVVKGGFALFGAGRMGFRQAGRAEIWARPISAEKLVYTLPCEFDARLCGGSGSRSK